MWVHIEYKKLVIITGSKTIYLSKDVDNSLKYEIDFIIKHNKRLVDKIKTEICQLLSKYEHVKYIHEHKNRQNQWPTQIFLICQKDYTQKARTNLLLLKSRKNIRQQCKNYIKLIKLKKIKLIAPMWNDEFQLPDGPYSVPDIQDCIN